MKTKIILSALLLLASPLHANYLFSNTVYEAQNNLTEANLYSGSVDGIYGKNTKNAIKKYQKNK